VSGFLENIFDELSVRTVLVTCLDILIVYYVIYRVLLTIKGTRAAQMVIGIVLIGASFFVAERLEMTTVSWLLDSFINYFIIIVIVVFQQDIRRGLMRLGQNVVPFGKTHQLSHALDEVLSAAEQLAKARMGGIVVFEREAELKQFVDHGHAIDARVSRELVVSLFVPSRDNELHDGAVIVDKNLRIARAGVVLPLSRSTALSSKLGTRHRAALGITEETDAVAVVISEERGEISLCFKGNIARDLETETLRRALQDLFDEESTVEVAQEAQAAADISRAVAALAAAEGSGGASTDPRRASTPSAPVPTVKSAQRGATVPDGSGGVAAATKKGPPTGPTRVIEEPSS
jgi:diadenylate cyclase